MNNKYKITALLMGTDNYFIDAELNPYERSIILRQGGSEVWIDIKNFGDFVGELSEFRSAVEKFEENKK